MEQNTTYTVIKNLKARGISKGKNRVLSVLRWFPVKMCAGPRPKVL